MTDTNNTDRAALLPVTPERCTCAEVFGEDPNCTLHGVETAWALENMLPSEWQTQVIELRQMLNEASQSHSLPATQEDAERSVEGDGDLRAHFTRMMEAAANYLEPTTYIARHPQHGLSGPCRFTTEFPMPDENHSDSAKADINRRRDQAFICDMIYMLDGPEQRAALTPSPCSGDVGGWIVGNSDGTKWRVWDALGPKWTKDRDRATRYARRVDAEQVHAEDEGAWRVEPFAALTTPQRQEYDGEAVRLRNVLLSLKNSRSLGDILVRIDAALAHPAQARDEMREEGAPVSDWSWWVGSDDSVTEEGRYDLYECGDRADAINWAECHVEPGERFHIVEARCRALQADDEFMPFIAKRNHATYVIDSEGRAALSSGKGEER